MALIVAHGLGRYAAEWFSCARSLDPEAIVPDLPELRRNDTPPDNDAVIAAMIGELDRRGIASATWLGHSGGGHTILAGALLHPARFARLILVSTVPLRSHLVRVTCPILLVFGEREASPVPALSHVSSVIIPGAGHDPHLEAPDALVAAVTSSISR